MKSLSKKKQVGTNKYNKEYFEKILKSLDYSQKVTLSSFGHVYRYMANINKLSSSDTVVDFGCGNGELSFCLYQKYKATVIGIDYSKDAIDAAKSNLGKLKKIEKQAKISFVNANNNHLPVLSNINSVYFSDVLEHMYDHEIDLVLKQIQNWNQSGIKIIVHTDNDLFLIFVRPLLDLLSIITRVCTVKDIKARNLWESERHVNLTNPLRLRKKLQKLGFKELRVSYPEVSMEEIESQLSGLSRITFIKKIVFFCLPILKFLSPSFYSVYEYKSS